jgi:hypothetical protein
VQVSALALCLAGCALPDYGETPFLCGENGACPQGYQCIRLECWRIGAAMMDAAMTPIDSATISSDAKPDPSRVDADASRPDAVIDASIDAAVDAATGNGQKYDPCGRNSDCGPDLCCDSELYQCLISSIARCMP